MSFLLLDTHLLIWAGTKDRRLSAEAATLIDEPTNALAFSAASIWEVAIKNRLGRPDFGIEPQRLRARLLVGGYREIPITSEHGIAVARLPLLHRDPFDRLLVAQAGVEGAMLLTMDRQVAQYRGPVRLVA